MKNNKLGSLRSFTNFGEIKEIKIVTFSDVVTDGVKRQFYGKVFYCK
jgi:hypothetical protein